MKATSPHLLILYFMARDLWRVAAGFSLLIAGTLLGFVLPAIRSGSKTRNASTSCVMESSSLTVLMMNC
jgi:hypothetical protein